MPFVPPYQPLWDVLLPSNLKLDLCFQKWLKKQQQKNKIIVSTSDTFTVFYCDYLVKYGLRDVLKFAFCFDIYFRKRPNFLGSGVKHDVLQLWQKHDIPFYISKKKKNTFLSVTTSDVLASWRSIRCFNYTSCDFKIKAKRTLDVQGYEQSWEIGITSFCHLHENKNFFLKILQMIVSFGDFVLECEFSCPPGSRSILFPWEWGLVGAEAIPRVTSLLSPNGPIGQR